MKLKLMEQMPYLKNPTIEEFITILKLSIGRNSSNIQE